MIMLIPCQECCSELPSKMDLYLIYQNHLLSEISPKISTSLSVTNSLRNLKQLSMLMLSLNSKLTQVLSLLLLEYPWNRKITLKDLKPKPCQQGAKDEEDFLKY